MRLTTHLREDLVLTGLRAGDAREVLAAVGTHLERTGYLACGTEVASALTAREEAQSTNLGGGLAVPHATLPSLPEMLMVVAVTDPPVAFGPPGTDPVDLLFVLLSPPGREGEHLRLLAQICRLAREPGFLDGLRATPHPRSLFRFLQEADARHP